MSCLKCFSVHGWRLDQASNVLLCPRLAGAPGVYPEFKVDASNYDSPLLLRGVPFSCAVPGSSLYVLTNIRIHTGRAGRRGSEHSVQGRTYDGEVSGRFLLRSLFFILFYFIF